MVFTGLVEEVGKATRNHQTCELRVYAPGFFEGCSVGDSISVNGVCLTLVEGWTKDNGLFFVMSETRGMTNLFLETKDPLEVNLEKSLSHGNSVGGHYVLGHVHGLGTVHSVTSKPDDSWDVWIDISNIPEQFHKIVHKGCIAVDGTSLTVAEISGKLFRVSLIPHTISHTVFRTRHVGDLVNIEFDSGLNHVQQNQKIYSDEDFMMEAIKVGEKGRCTAPPNPWVGCVICKDGRIIGIGYHAKAGEPHAEVMALRDAEARGNADAVKGSTVYVTLEPCHHFGRTPPCDAELIRQQVSRVVVAIPDPDLRVDGEGIKLMRKNNLEVTVGVCLKEAEKSLKSYLYHRKTGKPYVVLKAALSLDGRNACEDGTSKWITGEVARKHVHELRARCQAVMVGSETALKDDPRLTVRDIGVDVRPLRVVVDARGRVLSGNLLDTSQGPTLVFTSETVPQSSMEVWQKAGVEVKQLPASPSGGINLTDILHDLGKRGILQLLVEGGAHLQSSFLSQNFGNSLIIYYGACLIGNTGKPGVQGCFAKTMEAVKFWKLENVVQLENDVCLEYCQ